MVFESIVAYFLDKYLSSYIENFDSSKLKIGIWSGDVVLENLYLKTNALDELDLPFKIVVGHLKILKIKIPWKSLYTESVKVLIDGLTILIAPKSSVQYDAEREKKENIDNKLKQVKKLIDLEKNNQNEQEVNKSDSKKDDTFAERLQIQIVRNLELQIKNIHIRYEDDFSKPDHPFSAGVSLNSIEIKTADENWNPTFLKEDSLYIYKLASLNSLGIYCNSDEPLLKNEQKNKDIIISKLQNMITNTNDIHYILNPMSLTTRAILNMKPKQDNFMHPLFDLKILLELVSLRFNRLQYFDLIGMLNTLDQMALTAKYHKYRPMDQMKDAKTRWRFAYKAIIESQIRPRIEQFKWEHIKLITQSRRDYVNLLKKKHTSKLTNVEQEAQKNYEEILDVFNLVLAKKQADVEIARQAKAQETVKSTWWGWLSSSSSNGNIKDQDQEKISEALKLSQDEKAKLYDAIGYAEDNTLSVYPKDYTYIRINFILKNFEISMIDGEYKTSETPRYISEINFMSLSIKDMTMSLDHLPVKKGLKTNISVKSVILIGSPYNISSHQQKRQNDLLEFPILIEPIKSDEDFVGVTFEINPTDNLNKRIKLKTKSLKLVYDATTINNIVYFFRSTESLQKKKLKNAALRTISKAKERSIMYMKNNLQNIQKIDLNIDIDPSFLLVPQNGKFENDKKSICIDFGHLSLKSDAKEMLEKKESAESEESFHSADEDDSIIAKNKKDSLEDAVIEASYIKYQLQFKEIKVLIIDNNDFKLLSNNGKNSSLKFKDDCNILTPIDLFFNLHQCVYTNDAKLPAWKLFGNLPLIQLKLSDVKLERILNLAMHIPLPSSSNEDSNTDDYDLNDTFINSDELDEDNTTSQITTTQLKPSLTTDSMKSLDSKLQQTINIQLSFEINRIEFILSEEKIRYFDFISFEINSFGAFFQNKTYDNYLNVYLNQIKCEYGLIKDTNGSNLYLLSSALNQDNNEKLNLIDIKLIQTSSDSPTLSSQLDNILVNVTCEMRSIDFVLNPLAFRNVLLFVNEFQNTLKLVSTGENGSKKISKNYAKSNDSSQLYHSEEKIKELVNWSLLSKQTKLITSKKKKYVNPDLIDIKLVGKLDAIRVRICTRVKDYFQLNVNHFDLNMLNKYDENKIDLVLNSISVQDLDEKAKYKYIVSLKENSENLIKVNLVLKNPPKAPSFDSSDIANKYRKEKFYFKNYLDSNFFDLIVQAHVSKLCFVFLYQHLNILTNLIKVLDTNQDANNNKAIENDNNQQETIITNNNNNFKFLYRIKLDVKLDAPIVFVPLSLDKQESILLDCGSISVNTNLDIMKNYFKSAKFKYNESLINHRLNLPPILEVQKVVLSEMEISRVLLNEDITVKSELSLVSCSKLNIKVKRNLQPEIFNDIEGILVEGTYDGLLAAISQSDYKFALDIAKSFSQDDKISDSDIETIVSNSNNKIKKLDIEKRVENKIKSDEKPWNKLNESQTSNTDNQIVPKLSIKFLIQSIKLQLYEKDYELIEGKIERSIEDSFSKMELQTLQFGFDMFEETFDEKDFFKVIFYLDRILLDDTRQYKTIKKSIRLVEKYRPIDQQVKNMVDLKFTNKKIREESSDEMNESENNKEEKFVLERNVDLSVNFLRLCVNVDYLLSLADFFTINVDKQGNQEIQSQSNKKDSNSKQSTDIVPIKSNDKEQMIIIVKLENPQFILYENQYDLKKSNSVKIDGSIMIRLNISDDIIKFHTSIDKFMIKLKTVKTRIVTKKITHLILFPTSINFTAIINNQLSNLQEKDFKHQSFILFLQDINLNLSPMMLNTTIKMINSINSSLDKRFKKIEDDKILETTVDNECLFKPVGFTNNEFWFTQFKNPENMSVSSASSDVMGTIQESNLVVNKKCQLLIKTSKIYIKLESGLGEQIPLIGLNISLDGEINDWLYKPNLSIGVLLEMAYFNEYLSVWEPVIEPIEQQNDSFRPYEIKIEMLTNISDGDNSHSPSNKSTKSSIPKSSSISTIKNEEFVENLRAVRTFHIKSSSRLQFVVTKTLLNMLEDLGKTFQINDQTQSNSLSETGDYERLEIEEELYLNKEAKNINPFSQDNEENEEYEETEENQSFNFMIKNELGYSLSIQNISGFRFADNQIENEKNAHENKTIEYNQLIPISLSNSHSKNAFETIDQDQEHQVNLFRFKMQILDQNWLPNEITIGKSMLNGAYFNRKDSKSEALVIFNTIAKLDKRRLYIRSPVQIINTLNISVLISYPVLDESSPNVKTDYSTASYSSSKFKQAIIKPGDRWSIPLDTVSQTSKNFVNVSPILNSDENFEQQVINWTSPASHKLLSFKQKYFIQTLIEKKELNLNNKGFMTIDYIYNVYLLSPVTFYNYLPYNIKYQETTASNEVNLKTNQENILKPGECVKLINSKMGTHLLLEMDNYQNATWYSSLEIIELATNKVLETKTSDKLKEETNIIEFRSDSKIVTLVYSLEKNVENNCISLTLYSPYWVLNQTQLDLQYKFKGFDDEVYDINKSCNESPLLFKINSKLYMSKKKNLSLRVNTNGKEYSEWSDSFLIDVVGNNGTIASKFKNKSDEKYYEIGIDIKLSSTGLTKIIKLTPYYLLFNHTSYVLDIVELISDTKQSKPILLEPNSITPFWPSQYSLKNKNSIHMRPLMDVNNVKDISYSAAFWYDSKHRTVLDLSKNPFVKALCVECIPGEELIRTVFKPYNYGMAPLLIVNCLRDLQINIRQNDEVNDETFIMPQEYYMKTWKNPCGKHEIEWKCGNDTKIYNLESPIQAKTLLKISASRYAFVLSFLDGLQRVLMFVDKLDNLNDEITGYKEIKGDEYMLELDSLCLSLIDNRNQIEILYASLVGSGVSWGEKKKNNIFKAYPAYKINRIEEAYQNYLLNNELRPNDLNESRNTYKINEEGDEVDFDQMALFVGKNKYEIERHFAPSIYINYFSSPITTTLHLIVNKLQIDNQLYSCVFPVVFSKVLPPKSVTNSSISKPIIEMAMRQSQCKRTNTTEIKYFKILIQEFSIKLDIEFLNALSYFLVEEPTNEKKFIRNTNLFFKEMDEMKTSFHNLFYSIDSVNTFVADKKNQKIFFDYCHISPIKTHLSFSLSGADAFKGQNIFLDNPLFKSIGLVLTDMQDVVFKLGYFEVNNSVSSTGDLTKEIIDHYKAQVIRQAYILVFGLDVLGNPFGLIRGLAEGVESLFYEPYAGIVQGPGEFAEGVAIGIRNLFGNTLGGAAGALGKITGTLGKGLATLSLDKEYQKARQKPDAKPTFLKNLGQNLVMGFVDGVTGIVEKPIEGANKSGFGGALEGLGKGLLGVVTKPTAGIIDFTSQSLEGIRKVAIQEESADRIRPPRCIYQDKIIRPYSYKSAQGVNILKNLDKNIYANDKFVSCLDVSIDPKLVLIATNKHIMMVKDNLLFGNEMIHWSYELAKFLKPPELIEQTKELVFTIKNEEKKLFGSSEPIVKKVKHADQKALQRFYKKMMNSIKQEKQKQASL